MTARALKWVRDQFNDAVAQQELRDLGPRGFDWVARTRNTIEVLLPELSSLAIKIKREVPLRLNAPLKVLELLRKGFGLHPELTREPLSAWYEEILHAAEAAEKVVAHLESQQVSSAIQRFVISADGIGALVRRNGGSIYPDLVLKASAYDRLPRQTKKNPIDGPCLRGDNPSNVPDGCEIKTNQGSRVKVDAHGAHPGLHLAVTWEFEGSQVVVSGVWVGYVRFSDHKESGRNVGVTTVKHSFGHDLFASLLP